MNEQILCKWQKAAQANGQVAKGHGSAFGEWSCEDKFLVSE